MAHTSQMKKQVSTEKNFQIFSMVGRYQREILHILHKYKKKLFRKKLFKLTIPKGSIHNKEPVQKYK
jgi:hypothetical protein